MTFAPPTASALATRRLNLANGLLWIVAAITLVVIGSTTAYAFVVAPYVGENPIYNPNAYPWENDDPIVAVEVEPNVWTADGSAVIRIPAADFDLPRRASIVAGADLDLYRTNPADAEIFPGERPHPDYFGYLYGTREVMVVPSGHDLELWVRAAGPWRVRLAPIPDIVTIDDDHDGQGNATILYTGDAVSARFINVGEGIFFVAVYTAFDRDTGAIIETGAVNRRLSWDVDTWVVFEIEADANRGAWTIDIEQIAQPTPQPTEPEE